MTTYAQQLRDPRWQKRRLEIFERDDWACCHCDAHGSELHVHHVRYKYGLKPWEYGDSDLRTLCKACHSDATEITRAARDTLYDMLSEDAEGTRTLINAAAVALCFCPEAADVIADISQEVGAVVRTGFEARRRFDHADYMGIMTALVQCRDDLRAVREGIKNGAD